MRMSRTRSIAVMLVAISLTACGGGGGSDKPAPSTPVVVTPPPVVMPEPTKVDIKLHASSYENAKNIGIAPQTIPSVDATGEEQITNGYAFADFDKSGVMQMVAFTEFVPLDGSTPTKTGKVHFFKKDGADKWVENTAARIDDTTGCINPRKVIIADFNNDGKPDVFASCHGLDVDPFPGENQRVLLSQADGKFKNVMINHNAFAHGASAADINGDGNVDVLLADMRGLGGKTPLYFLLGDGTGNFVPDYARVNRPEFEYKTAFWAVELVKNPKTNRYDILAGGSETHINSNGITAQGQDTLIISADTANSFINTPTVKIPVVTDFEIVLDFIYDGDSVYVNRTKAAPYYGGTAIQKFNVVTGNTSTIYTHTGPYNGGPAKFAPNWVNWIATYGDKIVATAAHYNVSVIK